ncbi:MAG: hypothetical protein PHE50_02660 [Dehalococcoidales bacterium]|nr:hypothetical protein [Dehalococcoidales bacterium]MDD5189927.1 hypothetical protein [Dehalococcoidales bacterium]
MPKIDDYSKRLRSIGPAAWCEGPYGWIGEDGQPIALIDWQKAVLLAWWEYRDVCSTLGISNVKKTGKTLLNAVLTAWRWLALPGVHFAAGNDLDQAASRVFSEVADMVKRNSYLSANVKVTGKELVFIPTGSTLTALAVDSAGAAGANHLTASFTELWGVLFEAGVRFYDELTPPPGKKYGFPALRIVDSYAGFEGSSNTWHGLVDRGKQGEQINNDWPVFLDGGLILFHMEGEQARERCFRGTPKEAAAYYAEQQKTLRANAFTRMHGNTRTSNESAFIAPEAWAACYSPAIKPLQEGDKRKVILGADASTSHDLTSLIGCQYIEGGFIDVVLSRVWKPVKIAGIRFGKPTVDLDETIGAEVMRLHTSGNLAAVVCDPYQLHSLILKWEKVGIKVIELAQNAGRVESDQALYTAILGRTIRHYNDPTLNEHIKNAVAVESPRGYRLAKEKTSHKIDAAVALSMAHWGALAGKFVPQEATAVDNPFYIYSSNEQIPPKVYVTPHPEGVTWRNCRKRQRGICQACQKEMESEGVYENDRLRELASHQRTEAYIVDSQPGLHLPDHTSPAHGQAIASLFWNSIRNKGD